MDICLGTLALSGKYNKLTKKHLSENINAINLSKIKSIDWADIYSENGNDVLECLSKLNNWKHKKLIFKIGRINPLNTEEILKSIERYLFLGWRGKILIMFHNSNINYLNTYIKLIKIIKQNYNFIDGFGINVFNTEQVKEFSKIEEISEIQIPFNLIDAQKFNDVINLSKIYGLKVQVRSIFGAGLFAGYYKINDSSIYNDPIRKNWNLDNKINFERYKLFIDLKQKIEIFSSIEKKLFSIKELMLSFLICDKRIDTIILGGSNAKQINEVINYLSNNDNKNLFLNFSKFNNVIFK